MDCIIGDVGCLRGVGEAFVYGDFCGGGAGVG